MLAIVSYFFGFTVLPLLVMETLNFLFIGIFSPVKAHTELIQILFFCGRMIASIYYD